MVQISPTAVEEAVIRATRNAQEAGVAPENTVSVASVLAALDLLEISTGGETTVDPTTIKSRTLPETFAEWAARFELRTHFDRFVAIAVYRHTYSDSPTLDAHDVIGFYKQARWKQPQNPADVFAKAAAKRYFVESTTGDPSQNGTKRWQLTNTGISYLETLKMEETQW